MWNKSVHSGTTKKLLSGRADVQKAVKVLLSLLDDEEISSLLTKTSPQR